MLHKIIIKPTIQHLLTKLLLIFSLTIVTGTILHAQGRRNSDTFFYSYDRGSQNQQQFYAPSSPPSSSWVPNSHISHFYSQNARSYNFNRQNYNYNFDNHDSNPKGPKLKQTEQKAPSLDPEIGLLAVEKVDQTKRDQVFKNEENTAAKAQTQRNNKFNAETKKVKNNAQTKLNKDTQAAEGIHKKAATQRDTELKKAQDTEANAQKNREKKLKAAQTAASNAQIKRDRELEAALRRATRSDQAQKEYELKIKEKDTQGNLALKDKIAEKEKQDQEAKQNLELKLANLRAASEKQVNQDLESLFTRKEKEDIQAKQDLDRKRAEKDLEDIKAIQNQQRREALRAKVKDLPEIKLEPRKASPLEETLHFDPEYQSAVIYRLRETDAPLEAIVLNREYLIAHGNQVLKDNGRAMGNVKGDGKHFIRSAYKTQLDAIRKSISMLEEEHKNFSEKLSQKEQNEAEQAKKEAKDSTQNTEPNTQEKAEQEPRNAEKCENEKTERERLEQEEYGEFLSFENETPHMPNAFNDLKAIQNGMKAPSVEAVENLMEAAMGKGSPETGLSDASFDPSMAGQYAMSSFVYRDEKAGVSMEVGRVTKIDDLQTSFSDSPDTSDYLTLGSIKLSEAKESVTFAFHRPGEQILLKTDLTSMKNYVAQKQIEDYVYLTPDSARIPGANFENVPIYEEGSSPGFAKRAASTVADFLPYIGTTKTFLELVSGYDPITGEEVSRIVSAFGLVGSVVPIPGAGKTGKFVGKGVAYGVEYLAKNPGAFRKGFTRQIRKTPGKVTGGKSLKYIKEGDVWLRGTDGNAGKIPAQIADKLRGREFKSFKHFRETLWKEVANDSVLSKGFDPKDIKLMQSIGKAPPAPMSQWGKSAKSYEIHHINPIHNGGSVYDVDNLLIVTPRYHQEILDPKFHLNKVK